MSRRFQFSLKALLAGVVVVASFLGGMRFGERREKNRRHQEELRELEKYGQVGATIRLEYPDKSRPGQISETIIQVLPSDATEWPADWPTSIPVSRDTSSK